MASAGQPVPAEGGPNCPGFHRIEASALRPGSRSWRLWRPWPAWRPLAPTAGRPLPSRPSTLIGVTPCFRSVSGTGIRNPGDGLRHVGRSACPFLRCRNVPHSHPGRHRLVASCLRSSQVDVPDAGPGPTPPRIARVIESEEIGGRASHTATAGINAGRADQCAHAGRCPRQGAGRGCAARPRDVRAARPAGGRLLCPGALGHDETVDPERGRGGEFENRRVPEVPLGAGYGGLAPSRQLRPRARTDHRSRGRLGPSICAARGISPGPRLRRMRDWPRGPSASGTAAAGDGGAGGERNHGRVRGSGGAAAGARGARGGGDACHRQQSAVERPLPSPFPPRGRADAQRRGREPGAAFEDERESR